MASAIMTIFVIAITWAISIQMIIAPSASPDEEIGGVLKTEVRKLLNQQENLDKVVKLLTIAKKSTDEAKKEVKRYLNEDLPQNLKNLLYHIAEAPQDIYNKMKPILNELEIGGVLKTEVRKLLNQQENFDKIVNVFTIAKDNANEAKKVIERYLSEDLPQNLKNLLYHIAETPQDIYNKMKPILNELEIGGVLKTEVRKLLNQQENFDKIVNVFTIAKDNASEAKKVIERYLSEDIPQNLKNLLYHIAETPQDIYNKMKPMLNEICEKAIQLDKTLESESLAYRMIGKPVWGIVSGIGYLSLGALEFIINSLATLAQLFSNGAKQSVVAYNNGKQPQGRINQVFDTIDDGVGKVKGWGNKIGSPARDRFQQGSGTKTQ